MPQQLRIGTRASALARWQAEWVARELAERTGAAVELVPISTLGDRNQTGPIGDVGATGVFTREIQRALIDGQIDCAVHSLKDLPTDTVEGLELAAVPQRASPFDVLVGAHTSSFDELPRSARIATGSLRRRAQLSRRRPDLELVDIRGNVDTRLRKLDEGQFDALVLAEAGLTRLGLADRIGCVLPPEIMLPAIGQGALGIEIRSGDLTARELLASLDDRATHAAVAAERVLLATLRGGCLAPIGAWGRWIDRDDRVRLDAIVLTPDGRQSLVASGEANFDQAASLGERVANELLARGAADLIAASWTDS